MKTRIGVPGQGDVGMRVDPHHGHVVRIAPGEVGEGRDADRAFAAQRDHPIGAFALQQLQRGLHLAEDRIPVEHAIDRLARAGSGRHGNGEGRLSVAGSEEIEQQRPEVVAPRRVVGRQFRNPPGDVAALPLGIDQTDRFH